jgi:hypothetical protein
MKRNKITIKRNWIQIDNTFHLLVDIEGKSFYKKFSVLDVDDISPTIVALNKRMKEYDLVEQLRRQFNVRKVEFI